MNEPTKVAVSISEMARMVGLSRQRFHHLKGTTFPEPMRDPEYNRPLYETNSGSAWCSRLNELLRQLSDSVRCSPPARRHQHGSSRPACGSSDD